MAVLPAQGTAENGTIYLQSDFPCQDDDELGLHGPPAPSNTQQTHHISYLLQFAMYWCPET